MSQGSQALLGIHTAWPVTSAFEFTSFNFGKRGVILESDATRGRRSHGSERTRTGPYTCSGSVGMNPTPEELALLLPHVMGAAAVGTAFKLGDTFSDLFLAYWPGGGQLHKYSGVKVDKATFRGSEGSYLDMTLDLEGTTEELPGGSFPSIVAGLTQPFVFTDAVFTLGGSSRSCKEFTLVIDNVLDKARFFNSTTRASLPAQDRVVSLSVTVPYTSSEIALYDQALAGAAGSIAFTNSAYSLTFNFGRFQVPAETPAYRGKTETLLTLNGMCRKLGSTPGTTDEVDIVLDSTP